jgi:hypothetical protein
MTCIAWVSVCVCVCVCGDEGCVQDENDMYSWRVYVFFFLCMYVCMYVDGLLINNGSDVICTSCVCVYVCMCVYE